MEESSLETETVIVVRELVYEIAVTCCISATYDGYALAENRQRERLLQVIDTLFFQLSYYLLPTPRHIAKSERRVDVGDNP
jgi:hypothetical protein